MPNSIAPSGVPDGLLREHRRLTYERLVGAPQRIWCTSVFLSCTYTIRGMHDELITRDRRSTQPQHTNRDQSNSPLCLASTILSPNNCKSTGSLFALMTSCSSKSLSMLDNTGEVMSIHRISTDRINDLRYNFGRVSFLNLNMWAWGAPRPWCSMAK